MKGSIELREKQPHGAISKMAEIFGFSRLWIKRVIKGEDNGSDEIIKCATELAKANNKHETNLNKIYAKYSK